ncbi:MAG: DUF4595 domain-containing protein [Muribaculaceae bacterium]|nr:DUF4595 domain-containing protein [Muribaculaceae bacterium]
MKKNYFFNLVAVLIMGLATTSCHNDDKDNPDNPSGTFPRIAQIDWLEEDGSSSVWKNFTFDEDGRIVSYEDRKEDSYGTFTYKIEFHYSDNLITEYWEGEKIQNYIIEDGLIVELREGSIGRGFNSKLKYNSNRELIEISSDEWKETFTFTWSNGLLLSSEEISDDAQYDSKYTFTYSSFANKLAMNPYAFMDDDFINPFLSAFGYYGKVPTFLPSSIKEIRGDETKIVNLNYTIGSNGYPTKFETKEKRTDSYSTREFTDIWSLKWK